MFDFDRETWIYILLIASFLLYFFFSSRRAKYQQKKRKNRSFRQRYLERKKETSAADPNVDINLTEEQRSSRVRRGREKGL